MRPRRTATTIISRVQRGVGQGSGPEYRAAFDRREVPSRGRSSNLPLFDRTRHHCTVSGLERNVAILLAWDEDVLELQEQYPLLPVSVTQLLAASRGIRHPMKHGCPLERTLDFKVLHARLGWVGLSIKPASEVDGSVDATKQIGHQREPVSNRKAQRTRDLLELERAFSARMGWKWGLVSEAHVPAVRARNLDILRERWTIRLDAVDADRHDEIADRVSVHLRRGITLLDACNRVEHTLELPEGGGAALAICLNKIARKLWSVDLDQPFDPRTSRPRPTPPLKEEGWITKLVLHEPMP